MAAQLAHRRAFAHRRAMIGSSGAPSATRNPLPLPMARAAATSCSASLTSASIAPTTPLSLGASGAVARRSSSRQRRAPLAPPAATNPATPSPIAAVVPTAHPGKTTLAFVGIGIMGLAMAQNLLKAGYDVVVWNRSPERCAPLVAAGARLAATPREAASLADITFAMLADPPAALAVAQGPQGIAAGMSPGKGYVDVSTVDAATSRTVAALVRSQGGLFLEAPVSGSKGPAESGQLIFLTAGDEQLFEACSPALDVMGKARFYLGGRADGAVGAGAHMKLVLNQIMGSMMVALAEGLSLASAAGLDEKQVLEAAALGAISCPMFTLKGPAMVERRYPTAFPLKHQQKDLRLALELAEEMLGVDGQEAACMGVSRAAHEAYVRAAAADPKNGDADFSAVLEAVLPPRK